MTHTGALRRLRKGVSNGSDASTPERRSVPSSVYGTAYDDTSGCKAAMLAWISTGIYDKVSLDSRCMTSETFPLVILLSNYFKQSYDSRLGSSSRCLCSWSPFNTMDGCLVISPEKDRVVRVRCRLLFEDKESGGRKDHSENLYSCKDK